MKRAIGNSTMAEAHYCKTFSPTQRVCIETLQNDMTALWNFGFSKIIIVLLLSWCNDDMNMLNLLVWRMCTVASECFLWSNCPWNSCIAYFNVFSLLERSESRKLLVNVVETKSLWPFQKKRSIVDLWIKYSWEGLLTKKSS